MAEEGKQILISIRIDEEAAKKKIVELTRDLENNKKAQAALNKEIKASGEVTEKQAQQQVQLKSEYAKLTKQVNIQTKAIDTQKKSDELAAGSLDQLRAKAVELRKAYSGLSAEEQANANIGGILAAEINEVNIKIKEQSAILTNNKKVQEYAKGSVLALREEYGKLQEQFYLLSEEERKGKVGQQMQKDLSRLNQEISKSEQSIGGFSRSVGNYTGGILEAVDGTGLLATITAKAKGTQEAYTATLNITKASLAGNVSGLKAMRLALAATGIGAVVLLLGGLVSWLTRTQEGMDFVEKKTKGLTTVMAWLLDMLSDVGAATVAWFDGLETIGDFMTKLSDDVIKGFATREKGLSLLLDGLKNYDGRKIQDGFAQVTIAVEDATAKAKKFAAEMGEVNDQAQKVAAEFQAIEKAEIALTAAREKANVVIAKNKLIAEDVTKSEKERIEAAKTAAAELARITQIEIELQSRRLKNIKEENSLTKSGNAENRAEAEAAARLAQIEAQNTERSIELQNKINGIRKEGAANRAAAAKAATEAEQAAIQRRLADEKAALEISLLQTIEGSEQRLEANIRLAAKEMEIALTNKELTENQKKLIQAKFDADELKARKEHAQHLIDVAKKQAEDWKAAIEKEYQETAKATAEYYNKEALQATQARANGETSEQEYRARLREMHAQELQKQLQDARDYGQSTVAIEQEMALLRIDTRQQEAEAKKQIQEAEYQTAITIAGALGDLASIVSEQSSTAAEFQKAITLFQIGIDTARALSNIAQGATKAGVDAGIAAGPAALAVAPAVTALYYATNVAAVLANIAKAKQLVSGDAPKAPQFAAGGYTGAGAGTPDQSGFRVAGVVHEDEWVAPKWMNTNPMYAGVIAGLEKVRLRGYAAGGFVSPAHTAPPRFNPAAGGFGIDYNKLAAALAKQPTFVQVSEINRVQGQVARKAQVVNQ